MSRTRKGSKPVGYEYWGKRAGSFFLDRHNCHKKERMQEKEMLQAIMKDTDNLVERPTRLVYPVTDERIKALAIIAWGRHSTEHLMEENTHYSIEEEWFCNPDFLQANNLPADVVIGNYDDYLKEQSDVN